MTLARIIAALEKTDPFEMILLRCYAGTDRRCELCPLRDVCLWHGVRASRPIARS